MDLKEYIRVLQRRWIIALATLVVIVPILFAAQSQMVIPAYHQNSGTFLFKAAAYEYGYVPPDEFGVFVLPAKARRYQLTSDKTLDYLNELLGEDGPGRDSLRASITIAKGPTDEAVKIIVTRWDREETVRYLDLLIEAYKEVQAREIRGNVEAVEKSIKNNLAGVQSGLSQKEAARLMMLSADFRAQGIADPEEHAKIRSRILYGLEQSRQQSELQLRKAQERLQLLPEMERKLARKQMLEFHRPGAIPPVVEDDENKDLLRDLRDQERRLELLRERYREAHPEIIKVKDQISALRRLLQAEIPEGRIRRAAALEAQILILDSENRLLQKMLRTEYNQLYGLNIKRDQFKRLQTEIDALRERILADEDKLARAQVLKAKLVQVVSNSVEKLQGQTSPARIQPASPWNPWLIAVLALIISIAAAFGVDRLSDKLRNSQDLRTYLNMPTIASIPKLPARDHNLLTAAEKSLVYEMYNKLGTFVESLCSEHRARSILFTSAVAQEGKSTVSSNLAVALAKGGASVILVDSDMRRAQYHTIFGVPNEFGLSNLLAETPDNIPARLDEALQSTAIPGLQVLVAGHSPDNPVAMLKSATAKRLHDELKRRAQIVIFDSPPVLGVVDPAIIAGFVDMTIVLVAEGATNRHEAAQVRHSLTQVDANLVGAILNKAGNHPESYYYYYYHHYGAEGSHRKR